jgi:tetratricopeptide (TPR) repeat protein
VKASKRQISSRKLFWFKLIALSFPFLLFFLLEILLRVSGYGQSYQLFIRDPDRQGFLVMNPMVSEKYFTRTENATVGFFETFSAIKEPGTFRIFILGASTAVGFPYYHNGSFHRMLKFWLEKAYPDRHFEVINLGLTAVNSYTILDFSRQLPDYDPDAVLIYAGHNEYYGALGVGSTSSFGSYPNLVRWMLRLKELRLTQLLTKLFSNLASPDAKDDLRTNLMERMVQEQKIPYGSDLYLSGIRQFQENMAKSLAVLNDHQIPVFISNLVSNEKDLPPFISGFSSSVDTARIYHLMEQSDSLLKTRNLKLAAEKAQQAIAIDSSYARSYYLVAQALLQLGDHSQAGYHFKMARAYDQLRFRAPEEINQIIKTLAVQHQAHFADTETRFREHSPHEIIGQELLLEHLHPNLRGYFLIAQSFFQKISRSPLLGKPDLAIEPEQVWQEYPLTEVDSLYGAYGTLILKQGWPFHQDFEIDTTNRSLPEAIAGALVVKQLNWDQAMEKLYQHYHQQEQFDKALKVTEAVLLEYPHNASLYAKAGSLCMRLKNFQQAALYFSRALDLKQEPTYARYLAICLIQAGKLEQSLDFLHTFSQSGNHNPQLMRFTAALEQIIQLQNLKTDNKISLDQLNLLAKTYYLVGLVENARVLAQEILTLYPGNTEAETLLAEIDQKQNS